MSECVHPFVHNLKPETKFSRPLTSIANRHASYCSVVSFTLPIMRISWRFRLNHTVITAHSYFRSRLPYRQPQTGRRTPSSPPLAHVLTLTTATWTPSCFSATDSKVAMAHPSARQLHALPHASGFYHRQAAGRHGSPPLALLAPSSMQIIPGVSDYAQATRCITRCAADRDP